MPGARPRLGHIQFLNCLPLYYGMVKNDVLLDVDLVKADPAELATMIERGELDLAPIPAIEYARHAGELVLLPDIAISSNGEVQSILLLSKAPVEELGAGSLVALTKASRTSQVLARILLEKRWGVRPRYAEMPSDLAEMMRDADAALLIGDDALRAYWQSTELHRYDLGTVWADWTGLPMVYAVWAVRRAFAEERPDAVRDVIDALNGSLTYCRAHLDDISEYAARWEQFPAEHFRSYFDALQFRFEPRYREGLTRYLELAHEIGQLEEVPKLNVFGESAA